MLKNLILIGLCVYTNIVCSQIWEHTLNVDERSVGRDIIEDYDNGSLFLSLLYNNTAESSTFLTKYDINGTTIWSTRVGHLDDVIHATTVITLSDGSILIGGGELKFTNTSTSFLLKLDPCGEFEWLKIIGDDTNDDYLTELLVLNDGNILVQARYIGNERISLFKITPEGEILWRKNHLKFIAGANIEDPIFGDYSSPTVSGMLATEDAGFVLIGDIYIPTVQDTFVHELKSFVMKLDSEGGREWIYIHGDTELLNITQMQDLIEVSDGFVVFGSKIFNASPQSSIRSHLYKVDKNGVLLWEKEQTDTIMKTVGFDIEVFDDNTFALMTHAFTGSILDYPNYDSWVKVYKTDTLGNIIDTASYGKGAYINTRARVMSKTSDNKMLIAGLQDSTIQRFAYALRIQEDLSIDTFTNEVYTYDSLCSHTITDGFIAFDTAVSIININNTEYDLLVYPNPVSKYINFKIEALENISYNLNIYNITGKRIKREENIKEELLQLNLEDLSIGNYFYTLEHKNNIIAEGKFVKF